jgi:hypothetical protein
LDLSISVIFDLRLTIGFSVVRVLVVSFVNERRVWGDVLGDDPSDVDYDKDQDNR